MIAELLQLWVFLVLLNENEGADLNLSISLCILGSLHVYVIIEDKPMEWRYELLLCWVFICC